MARAPAHFVPSLRPAPSSRGAQPAARSRLALALVASCLVIAAPSARAQEGPVAWARARYAQADFAGALEALEALEALGTLSLRELLDVLELRALAARALGREDDVDRALRTIAAIRPDHALSTEAPPLLRQRFAALAAASTGPPRVEVEVQGEDGISLAARVADDPEHVVARVELRARVDGGEWRRSADGAPALDAPLTLDAPQGARVEWEAIAIGPARAPIARARGEHVVGGRARSVASGGGGAAGSGGGGDDVWIALGVGGGVLLIGGAIALGVVLATSGIDTSVEGPVLAELRFGGP